MRWIFIESQGTGTSEDETHTVQRWCGLRVGFLSASLQWCPSLVGETWKICLMWYNGLCMVIRWEHTKGLTGVPVKIITATPNQKWLLETETGMRFTCKQNTIFTLNMTLSMVPKFLQSPFWTILSGFFWNDQQMMPEFTKTFHLGGGKPQIKCCPCRSPAGTAETSELGGFWLPHGPFFLLCLCL